MGLSFILGLMLLTYLTGSLVEKRHYDSIRKRERRLRHIVVIANEWTSEVSSSDHSQFVRGSVVVGSDYFKVFLASIRAIFGGRISSFESLLDRARREAILRLKEEALARGASKVINLRLETSSIGRSAQSRANMACVEVHAYATALITS